MPYDKTNILSIDQKSIHIKKTSPDRREAILLLDVLKVAGAVEDNLLFTWHIHDDNKSAVAYGGRVDKSLHIVLSASNRRLTCGFQ